MIIEKNNSFCDFINKNVIITTKFSTVAGVNKPVEKICSEWDSCKNREYCKHGRISN